jgi:hypothetical protein
MVAAALPGIGDGLAVQGRWRDLGRCLLTVGRGIVCARLAALAA